MRGDGQQRDVVLNNRAGLECLYLAGRNDQWWDDLGDAESSQLSLDRGPYRKFVHEKHVEIRLVLPVDGGWSVVDVAHEKRALVLQYPSTDPGWIEHGRYAAGQIVRHRPKQKGVAAIVIQQIDGGITFLKCSHGFAIDDERPLKRVFPAIVVLHDMSIHMVDTLPVAGHELDGANRRIGRNFVGNLDHHETLSIVAR